MRRFILFLLIIALAGLVLARAALGAASSGQTAEEAAYGRNELDLTFPPASETAGSALVSQMSLYFRGCPSTAKSVLTGALAGKNLILICADGWRVGQGSLDASARAVAEGGVRFSDVYRPDWYQGMDGREFALLSGLVPTTIGGMTALAWTGSQDIELPFALARVLASEGYACRAYPCQAGRGEAYEALGFSLVHPSVYPAARSALEATLDDALTGGPFFCYYVWPDEDGTDALAYLMSRLEEADLAGDTAVCLLAAAGDERRANLFLWGGGLSGVTADRPCSELDLTPTLLNLFGADFDSRLLSGGDVLAPDDDASVVSLYGSAYSDWVTERGRFSAGDGVFQGTADEEYVRRICRRVYERYIYSRRLTESNYGRLLLS